MRTPQLGRTRAVLGKRPAREEKSVPSPLARQQMNSLTRTHLHKSIPISAFTVRQQKKQRK